MKNLDYNIEGADCGRFPVKPKSSLGGKIHTENHRCRTCRVADVSNRFSICHSELVQLLKFCLLVFF